MRFINAAAADYSSQKLIMSDSSKPPSLPIFNDANANADDGGVRRVSNVTTNASTISNDIFCASCDRCRSRKIKCDGERPCKSCTVSYMKKNKIKDVSEVDLTQVECFYSVAKKRGPIPKHMKLDKERMEQVRKKQRRLAAGDQQQVPREVTASFAAAAASSATSSAATASPDFPIVYNRNWSIPCIKIFEYCSTFSAVCSPKIAYATQ